MHTPIINYILANTDTLSKTLSEQVSRISAQSGNFYSDINELYDSIYLYLFMTYPAVYLSWAESHSFYAQCETNTVSCIHYTTTLIDSSNLSSTVKRYAINDVLTTLTSAKLKKEYEKEKKRSLDSAITDFFPFIVLSPPLGKLDQRLQVQRTLLLPVTSIIAMVFTLIAKDDALLLDTVMLGNNMLSSLIRIDKLVDEELNIKENIAFAIATAYLGPLLSSGAYKKAYDILHQKYLKFYKRSEKLERITKNLLGDIEELMQMANDMIIIGDIDGQENYKKKD